MTSDLLSLEQRQKAKDQIEELWRAPLSPPREISVPDWCEENVVLPPGTPFPGYFRISTSPYLCEILGCLKNPDVRTITLTFAAQSGKTLTLILAIFWTIDQDPAPIIFAIATQQQASDVSRTRFDPIVEGSDKINALKRQDRHDYTIKTKRFRTSTVYFAGGQSVREACSRPAKILILDEVDKFKGATQAEGGVFDQFKERTKAWQGSKVFQSGTPTVENGAIWKEFTAGDQSYFFVPCPHCGTKQKLIWEQLHWSPDAKKDDGWDIKEAKASTFYECINAECRGRIEDKHKPEMLAGGEWIPTYPERKSHRSFHLSSLYPQWITFGDVVEVFLQKKKSIDGLKSFRTDWLAEAWEQRTRSATQQALLLKCGNYKQNEIKEPPIGILMTVDPKKLPTHYVIRSWCYGETSYLLDFGTVPNLDDIKVLAQQRFGGYPISKVLIDSGWEGRKIEDFCRANNFIPIKGYANLTKGALTDWGQTEEHKLPLLLIGTIAVKDALFSKLDQTNGPLGSWYLPQETPTFKLGPYLHQMTSEFPSTKLNKQGFDVRTYERLHEKNHWLDCEVYQLAASVAFKIKNQPAPTPRTHPTPEQQASQKTAPLTRQEPANRPSHFDRLKKYK